MNFKEAVLDKENCGTMTLNDLAWEKLFEKYDIRKCIEQDGMFQITANQIKEFREPRLMTKFDTKESLPRSFGKGKEKKLSILPNTRGSYIIGYFDAYEELPEMSAAIQHIDFPDYLETISRKNINSEANVINVLGVTNILGDFLKDETFIQTISGRMKSGVFSFGIQDIRNSQMHNIYAANAQIEIDAGFESRNYVAIIEAKNVVHKDFIVRQLYYPYRLWKEQVTKPVRTIFMVYSNNIFRLLEYEFANSGIYSSVSFLRQKNYSFEDVDIKEQDIWQIYYETAVVPEPQDVPFIQADSFPTVISVLELIREEPKSISVISEAVGFAERQGDYYFNGAKYLGLAEKYRVLDEIKVRLSVEGEYVMRLPYKERQLKYIEKMFQHEILREGFRYFSAQGNLVMDKKWIKTKIKELRLCGDSLIERRASTVQGWLRWIFASVNE